MRRHPRPWHPVARCAAVSIAAHAVVALAAWRVTAPAETPRLAALTVRLVERSAALVRGAAAGPALPVAEARREAPQAAATGRRRTVAVVARNAETRATTSPAPATRALSTLSTSSPMRPKSATPATPATSTAVVDDSAAAPRETAGGSGDAHDGGVATAAPVPPAVDQAISGAVFALPHIAFGGAAAPSRWIRAARPPSVATATPASPAPPRLMAPDPGTLAHAWHAAGRAELIAALGRQIGALTAPADTGAGSCRLAAQAETALDCDSPALHEALTPQAAALSGLLQAYRSMERRAGVLLIGYSNGRYEVSLAMDGEKP